MDINNFHVLSNLDIECIIAYSASVAIISAIIFGNLGRRDPSPTYKKGIVAKIVPCVLLLLSFSDLALIISRYIDYPWNIEPQPSNASAFREMQELVIDPIWGWANDYQMDIVGQIGGCVCSLCWTAYAFCFKRSDTNKREKTFKVIAYILLSMVIIGFSFHTMVQLLAILIMFVLPATVLLFFARVKPKKGITTLSMATETVVEGSVEKTSNDVIVESKKEDDIRFMPNDVSYSSNVEGKKIPVINEELDNIVENPFHQLTDPIEKTNSVEVAENELKESAIPLPATIKYEGPINAETENMKNSSDTMFCKYCGKEIESDSTFCKYCGRKL